MKRITKFWVILLIFLTPAHLIAQSKDAKKVLKEADEHYKYEDFHHAIPLYLQVYKEMPNDAELNYKIAKCYHAGRHEIKAIPYLEKAMAAQYDDPDILYMLAHGYHKSHDFDKAISFFSKYKSILNPKETELIQQVEQDIIYCNNAKEMVANPVDEIIITNLGPGINTPFNDFAPVVSADESTLIFTSRRDNTTGGLKDEYGEFYEDLYLSVKSDTVWTTATNMGTLVNTESHDASVGLAPSGDELFIYRATPQNGGDLYVSQLKGKIWSEPEELGDNINTKYWEPHATVTADERTLFFTSAKPGGYGGRDIYMSRLLGDGTWAKAILLGPEINTEFDEDGPFIHADGKTLYFSSKGHKSMGGFDIFRTEIDVQTGKIIGKVENVGYPINTADDDVFFVWSADNKRAYFSSERDGGYGEKDIYMLERKDAIAELVVIKGKVVSCDTRTPVEATIIITDLEKQEPVGIYQSNSETGKYTVVLPHGKNYSVTVEAPGYLFYSKNINIPESTHYIEIKDEICMDRFVVGKKIVLRNVFFDVDKASLRPESTDELEKLHKILTQNPDMKIEISGHTDSDGSDEHNLKLSDARAKSVVDYLVKNGISASRLTWKGYGETQPEVPNDTPENKQLNRRTEIKILE